MPSSDLIILSSTDCWQLSKNKPRVSPVKLASKEILTCRLILTFLNYADHFRSPHLAVHFCRKCHDKFRLVNDGRPQQLAFLVNKKRTVIKRKTKILMAFLVNKCRTVVKMFLSLKGLVIQPRMFVYPCYIHCKIQ